MFFSDSNLLGEQNIDISDDLSCIFIVCKYKVLLIVFHLGFTPVILSLLFLFVTISDKTQHMGSTHYSRNVRFY